MHTPDNPYVLYVRPTEVEHHKKLVADWIAARGGVAVWYAAALEMAGQTVVTPALTPAEDGGDASNTQRPGWQWERAPRQVITDPACIRVEALRATPRMTRTYVDLELLSIAAELAGVQLEVECRIQGEPCDGLHPDHVEQHMRESPSSVPTTLNIHHRREAHNGNGYHVGRELYIAHLPIAPWEPGDQFHGPGRGRPAGLAAWLVRVDESAMEAGLLDAPAEPEVVRGWWCAGTGDFILDEDFERDGREEADDSPWVAACRIDGEIVPDNECEAALEGAYCRPDNDFAYQEMCSVLAQLLRQGVHRAFDPETGGWTTRDTFGSVVG